MSDQKLSFDEKYATSMKRIVRRSKGSMAKMRSTAIGGASASAALVLVLGQIHPLTLSLRIALFAAATAIPSWVGTWQLVEGYILFGRKSHEHYFTPGGSGPVMGLAVLGSMLLFTAIVSFIASMSSVAACTMAVVSLTVLALMFRQTAAISVILDRAEATDQAKPAQF